MVLNNESHNTFLNDSDNSNSNMQLSYEESRQLLKFLDNKNVSNDNNASDNISLDKNAWDNIRLDNNASNDDKKWDDNSSDDTLDNNA